MNEELVTAALLGTSRRPFEPAGLPGVPHEVAARLRDRDPAAALLGAAVMATVAERAGRRTVRAEPAEPAPAERRRPVSREAAVRLGHLLVGDDIDLLAIWLRLARERGLVAPPIHVPALLELTARRATLIPTIVEVVGERGRWLAVTAAGRRPEWARLFDQPDDELGDKAWELGSPAQRRRWLADARAADPDAARAALEASWRSEVPTERAPLLATLATGLRSADEPFLETCLDDRRREVREVAVSLLVRLPGSALRQRMRARGLAVLRGTPAGIAVTRPAPVDDAAIRDGVVPFGGRGGEGAWLVEHVVAATPVDAWIPALGASPAAVLARPVLDNWASPVHRGLLAATVAQRDAGWASAMIDATLHGPEHVVLELVKLLPAQEYQERLAALLLRGRVITPRSRLVLECPGPWTVELTRALLARVADPADRSLTHWRPALRAAGLRMPVELAEETAALARALGPTAGPTTDLIGAAKLAALRRTIAKELQP